MRSIAGYSVTLTGMLCNGEYLKNCVHKSINVAGTDEIDLLVNIVEFCDVGLRISLVRDPCETNGEQRVP